MPLQRNNYSELKAFKRKHFSELLYLPKSSLLGCHNSPPGDSFQKPGMTDSADHTTPKQVLSLSPNCTVFTHSLKVLFFPKSHLFFHKSPFLPPLHLIKWYISLNSNCFLESQFFVNFYKHDKCVIKILSFVTALVS